MPDAGRSSSVGRRPAHLLSAPEAAITKVHCGSRGRGIKADACTPKGSELLPNSGTNKLERGRNSFLTGGLLSEHQTIPEATASSARAAPAKHREQAANRARVACLTGTELRLAAC